MIHSMTGFGRGQSSANGITASAEIKSVNSRYLDISFYIPKEIQDKELELKERVQDKLNRGKVNITIRIDKTGTAEPDIEVNSEMAKSYKDLLDNLRHSAGLKEPIRLQDLMEFDEIFTSHEQNEEVIETIYNISKEALEEALSQLVETRAKEGKQLQDDLNGRVDNISNIMNKIQDSINGRSKEIRDNLMERIEELVHDQELDKERLEMEVAILVDKQDITEELVRTQAHLKFFNEALANDEQTGRRLKFLAQEMNREINTIGSKANSSEISKHVVEAKENLEQIREQIANVE